MHLGNTLSSQHNAKIQFYCNANQTYNAQEEPSIIDKLCQFKSKAVKGVYCSIDTIPGKVVCVKPYSVPQALEDRVLAEIEKLKEKKYIVESSSSWCNNMVPVTKPDGGIRITINFKMLNQLVQPDKYSLPKMNEIIHGLQGQKFFSKIDLKDGFFHIPVKKEHRHKTAFRVKNRLYEWNVMPQGFINSPAIFQRFMDKILSGLIGKFCYVYIDDILIFEKMNKVMIWSLKKF